MKRRVLVLLIVLIACVVIINSCVHKPYVLPESQRTGDPTICFERDVLPIFISNCAKGGCHNAESHKGDYTLDNYTGILQKGIVPGNPPASTIWESVAIPGSGVKHMPENAPDLTPAQLDVIKRWIATGAINGGACSNNCDSNNFTFSGAIMPMMQVYCIGCHNSPSAEGGSLANYNDIKAAAENGALLGTIAHLPGYPAMPPTGMQLSACQIAQVRKWIEAGALNN